MSLRRSARVQSSSPAAASITNGHQAQVGKTSKKRARKSQTTEEIAIAAVARPDQQDETNGAKLTDSAEMPPPPSTPLPKKRRVAKNEDSKPPPFTPTPSAVGLMAGAVTPKPSYSSGDIDDPTPPPPNRRAEPNRTNATLVTPRGTQVEPGYSSFEDNSSPSKSTPRPDLTAANLLERACSHLISVAPELKPVIEKHHCRVFSQEGLDEEIDPFRSLASGIMAQQVSGAAAKSIKNKFIGLFDPSACPNGFPTPTIVAQTPLPRLREAGLSQRKAEYIQGMAEKFVSGELSAQMLMQASDEVVMKSLVAIRGLGAWSVEMFMCFGLKRMDVFSTGDLGVQRGMAAFKGRDVAKLKAKGGGKWKYMKEEEMVQVAEPFRPYRSLFMWYMWRIEDVDVAAVENA